MMARLGAAAVHILTASGAVLALLALRAAHQHDWQMMFVWLGIALLVDAVDGPLARRLDVKRVLPRFSGERLDLIVDYLTYVAVPAYALIEAPLLPEADRNHITAGLGWRIFPNVEVNVAYQYINQNDRRGRVRDAPEGEEPTAALNSGLYTFVGHLFGTTLTLDL